MRAHRSSQTRRSQELVPGVRRIQAADGSRGHGAGKKADPRRGGSAVERFAQAVLVCFERTAESFELAYRLGFSFGLQLVGIVDEAIHQGVGKGRISEGRMP